MPRDLVAADGRLLDWIGQRTGGEVGPARVTPLLNGAVLRHWLIEFALRGGRFAGPQRWVLRADGATPLGLGLPRAQEFAVQRALFAAGLACRRGAFHVLRRKCDRRAVLCDALCRGRIRWRNDCRRGP